MRDIDTIDGELRLLVAIRRIVCEAEGRPPLPLSAPSRSAYLGTELLVDLRPVFEGARRSEDDPVVNLAVGQYEADRCPLGYGRLLEDKRFA